MWTRLLFWLRGLPPRASQLLASWKTSVVLLVLAALYDALLALWARSAPAQAVRELAGLLPLRAAYLLLLLSTAWCLWKRLPGLRRDVGRAPAFSGAPPRWELRLDEAATQGQAEALLREAGYRVATIDGSVWGVLRPRAALGAVLFHLGVLLLALGLLLTQLARDEFKLWVGVGEDYVGLQEQILSRELPRALSSGLPKVGFRVERIEPELWRGELAFTRLAARLRFPGGAVRETRIDRPLWLSAATFLRVSGFGYALRYEILDREGRVIESAFVKLNVLPPGQRDSIAPQGLPHRVYVRLVQDPSGRGAAAAARSLDLRNPAFAVHAYRGKVDLGERVIKLAEPIPLEELVLRIPEVRYWGEFTLLRDPGAPLVMLAFAIVLAGLALSLRGARAEVRWSSGVFHGFGAAERPGGREPAEGT